MATFNDAELLAEKEKNGAAFSSVLAAIFIAAFKMVVGILTHSLGIMAEAAHSALDLIAAFVTFFAVRISNKAPDEKKMFGYGKVENFSALIETILLLVTCGWIIYEAVDRLFFKSVEVEISIWSFIVMITSIVINISRSRVLMRVAKKHGSQALEADALHFETDVWSSYVVIGGLLLVTLAKFLSSRALVPQGVITWLNRADSIAALGVSAIVIYVSLELGKRTIDALLDSAPKGLHDQIVDKVSKIPGLLKIRQVRIRPSGPSTFIDMILEIPRSVSFEEAHHIGVEAKAIVKSLVERADVIVHMDPMVQDRESVVETVHSVAGRNGLSVHSIRVNWNDSRINLDMHIEVPESDTVAQAHERVSRVEAQLRNEILNLDEISTHIEPQGDQESRHIVNLANSDQIKLIVTSLPKTMPDVKNCHNIIVYKEGENYSLSFHCTLSPTISISEAHRITAEMERRLIHEISGVDRVYIHVEPPEDASSEG